jgi:hypothetical protein
MELPTAPFYRRWSVILAGVIGLAAIAGLVGWQGLQDVATPETTATSSPPTTTLPGAAPTTTTPPTSFGPTSKPVDVLWHEESSEGGKRSPGFRAPDRWRIQWAFDCSNFERYGGGNFKITGDGAFEQQVQIENVAIEATGTRRFNRGGYGRLRVESVCDRWTVTVLAG